MLCRWAIEETLNSRAVSCYIRHGIIRKCRKLRAKKREKTKWTTRIVQDESYTRPESYTLSFTGNSQYTKGFSRIGVGNVGEKQKTFFGGINSGNAKHRTSLWQTSVLSGQNIGTFPQRSPMFLVSGRANEPPKNACLFPWLRRIALKNVLAAFGTAYNRQYNIREKEAAPDKVQPPVIFCRKWFPNHRFLYRKPTITIQRTVLLGPEELGVSIIHSILSIELFKGFLIILTVVVLLNRGIAYTF